MTKIGLVSDTHGTIDEKLLDFFADCDQIWHAGDWGNIYVSEVLEKFKPVIGVYGNIDDWQIRNKYPEHQRFNIENLNVWITHIGGYPGKYDIRVRKEIIQNPPDLFICGHSHILKIMYDKNLNLWHINPGAYGYSGFHKKRTAVKFVIDGKKIKNLQILELSKKRKID